MSLFKPMLAGKVNPPFDLKEIKFPVLVSPKLDGIRATIQEGRVYSRSLKLIPNQYTQDLFGNSNFNGLDGELILGEPTDKDSFRNTTSAVMSIEGKPLVKYYVFDHYHPNCGFQQRFEVVEYPLVVNLNILIVPHFLVENPSRVFELEEIWLTQGYEGLMIRSLNGLYKQGRSTLKEGYLLKLKRFLDSEAVVIGFEEKMYNDNPSKLNELGYQTHSSHKENLTPAETLGALVVRDLITEVEFNIGTGFDDNDRKVIWSNREYYNHKIVKYKYFPTGSKDKPRFPSYQGWRSTLDIGESNE